jgi:NADH:ubiquinone oxidoreductase subunit 2 (subunit N)
MAAGVTRTISCAVMVFELTGQLNHLLPVLVAVLAGLTLWRLLRRCPWTLAGAWFFVLLALFGTGMNLMVLAGSIDVLFAGWEFLGISSALLIGFFHERRNAVDAALRAFVTYRICDVGLFGASVVIHRATGTGDFASLFSGDWPHATCLVAGPTAVVYSQDSVIDLARDLVKWAKKVEQFVINLEAVDYIDSSGIGALIYICSTIKKMNLKLIICKLL